MNTRLLLIATASFFALGFSTACTDEQVQARGFALPAGDAADGEAAFVRLQCQQCHQVSGLELTGDSMIDGPVEVELGGTVSKVQTYGDLVTSIINPSHRIRHDSSQVLTDNGKSLMTVYNEKMTVQELIDIVAFLQPKYQVVIPPMPYPTGRHSDLYRGDVGANN